MINRARQTVTPAIKIAPVIKKMFTAFSAGIYSRAVARLNAGMWLMNDEPLMVCGCMNASGFNNGITNASNAVNNK